MQPRLPSSSSCSFTLLASNSSPSRPWQLPHTQEMSRVLGGTAPWLPWQLLHAELVDVREQRFRGRHAVLEILKRGHDPRRGLLAERALVVAAAANPLAPETDHRVGGGLDVVIAVTGDAAALAFQLELLLHLAGLEQFALAAVAVAAHPRDVARVGRHRAVVAVAVVARRRRQVFLLEQRPPVHAPLPERV